MTFSPPIMVCSWSATSLCLPIPPPHNHTFYSILCFRTPYWIAVSYRLIQHQSAQITGLSLLSLPTISSSPSIYRSVSVQLFICSCVISKSFMLHSPQQYGFSAISQYGQFWHLGGI
jgi:hypothetical protein